MFQANILNDATSVFSKIEKGIRQLILMTERDQTRIVIALKMWIKAYDRLIGHDADHVNQLLQSDMEITSQVLQVIRMENVETQQSDWWARLFMKHNDILKMSSMVIAE